MFRPLSETVFAGIETTYSLLQWLILYMSANPDIHKSVQIEIDEEIGSSRPIEISDRSRLNYTWATILDAYN